MRRPKRQFYSIGRVDWCMTVRFALSSEAHTRTSRLCPFASQKRRRPVYEGEHSILFQHGKDCNMPKVVRNSERPCNDCDSRLSVGRLDPQESNGLSMSVRSASSTSAWAPGRHPGPPGFACSRPWSQRPGRDHRRRRLPRACRSLEEASRAVSPRRRGRPARRSAREALSHEGRVRRKAERALETGDPSATDSRTKATFRSMDFPKGLNRFLKDRKGL